MEPSVTLTNPDKVLYPATGTTKQEVFDYYSQIAPYMLPHLAGRPVTRRVWPNGVDQPMFYSKDTGRGTPDWIERVPIQHQNSVKDYPLINSKAALEWDAQTAGLEIHVPQWRIDDNGTQLPPDRMVIDLDPGTGATLADCARVALMVKEIVNGMGLELYPCTSGSKGIHLYAPLTGQSFSGKPLNSDQVSALAKELAQHLEAEHPNLVISTMSKAARTGKVMVDWSQNNGKKTTISPYSLRGVSHPYAVAPRTWKEIADPNLRQLDFTEILKRAKKNGDLLAGLLADNPHSLSSRTVTQTPPVRHSAARSDSDADRRIHSGVAATEADGSENLSVPEPMLAVMASQGELAMLHDDGNSPDPKWRFEMKWDGYRAIAIISKGKNGQPVLRLRSRNGQDYTERYPELGPLAKQVGSKLPVILDGEIVALTKGNLPSFRDLQAHNIPVSIEIFDILQLGNKSLVNKPFDERREILESTVTEAGNIHISPMPPYADAMHISQTLKLEGVMAKRGNAKYQPGARSKDWLKIKHLQEGTFFIVGYKPYHQGEANENVSAIGSLLLARKTENGNYQFVGRVGTGFTEKLRRELQAQLRPLTTKSPAKGITGLNKAESVGAVWVKPKLEGNVEFAEWTTDDADAPQARLRHPRWRGLTT